MGQSKNAHHKREKIEHSRSRELINNKSHNILSFWIWRKKERKLDLGPGEVGKSLAPNKVEKMVLGRVSPNFLGLKIWT